MNARYFGSLNITAVTSQPPHTVAIARADSTALQMSTTPCKQQGQTTCCAFGLCKLPRLRARTMALVNKPLKMRLCCTCTSFDTPPGGYLALHVPPHQQEGRDVSKRGCCWRCSAASAMSHSARSPVQQTVRRRCMKNRYASSLDHMRQRSHKTGAVNEATNKMAKSACCSAPAIFIYTIRAARSPVIVQRKKRFSISRS